MLRIPAVSGQFYPGTKEALLDTIEGLKPTKESPKASYRGIIMPHAGYIYSGKVAIATASRLLPKFQDQYLPACGPGRLLDHSRCILVVRWP